MRTRRLCCAGSAYDECACRIKQKWKTKERKNRLIQPPHTDARCVPYAKHGRWKSGDGTKGPATPAAFHTSARWIRGYSWFFSVFFRDSLHSYEEWSSVCRYCTRALDIYLRPFIIVTITSQELSVLSFVFFFFLSRFDTRSPIASRWIVSHRVCVCGADSQVLLLNRTYRWTLNSMWLKLFGEKKSGGFGDADEVKDKQKCHLSSFKQQQTRKIRLLICRTLSEASRTMFVGIDLLRVARKYFDVIFDSVNGGNAFLQQQQKNHLNLQHSRRVCVCSCRGCDNFFSLVGRAWRSRHVSMQNKFCQITIFCVRSIPFVDVVVRNRLSNVRRRIEHTHTHIFSRRQTISYGVSLRCIRRQLIWTGDELEIFLPPPKIH